MKIKNLEVIEGKKDRFLTVNFNISNNGETTENWATIRAEGTKHIFNSIIYIKDPEKMELEEKLPRTPNPELYYNSQLTGQVFKSIINSKKFMEYERKYNIKMDRKMLFDRNQILEREENLKKLIKVALIREEFIGAICDRGNYYIPLFNFDPGWHLEAELPGGEEYRDRLEYVRSESGTQILKDVNRLLDRLEKCSENTFAVKMESFLDSKVTKEGEEEDFGGVLGWELPEDVIFFDEIFYTETIVRLAKELIEGEDEEIMEYEADIINKYEESEEVNIFFLFDEYYIADTIIYDDELYFSDKCYEFYSNKEKYLKKIKKDFTDYIDFGEDD